MLTTNLPPFTRVHHFLQVDDLRRQNEMLNEQIRLMEAALAQQQAAKA